MTVPTSDNREEYTGNDATTSFDYAFKIFEDSDLRVYLQAADGTETLLVLNTDYSVSGAGDLSGGSVSYPLSGDPLASDEKLIIIRVLEVVQETDLRNQGAYYPQVVEDEFDRSRMIDQQQQEELDRSLKRPAAEDGYDADGRQIKSGAAATDGSDFLIKSQVDSRFSTDVITKTSGRWDAKGLRMTSLQTSDTPQADEAVNRQHMEAYFNSVVLGGGPYANLRTDLSKNTAGNGSDLTAHTGTSDTVTEALDKRTIYVGSVAELSGYPVNVLLNGAQFELQRYHPSIDIGGGPVYWDATRSKADHNGGTVIDPTKSYPADWSIDVDVLAWFTPGTGAGCFVRSDSDGGVFKLAEFGAFTGGTISNSRQFQALLSALPTSNPEFYKKVVIFPAGELLFDFGGFTTTQFEGVFFSLNGAGTFNTRIRYTGPETYFIDADSEAMRFNDFTAINDSGTIDKTFLKQLRSNNAADCDAYFNRCLMSAWEYSHECHGRGSVNIDCVLAGGNSSWAKIISPDPFDDLGGDPNYQSVRTGMRRYTSINLECDGGDQIFNFDPSGPAGQEINEVTILGVHGFGLKQFVEGGYIQTLTIRTGSLVWSCQTFAINCFKIKNLVLDWNIAKNYDDTVAMAVSNAITTPIRLKTESGSPTTDTLLDNADISGTIVGLSESLIFCQGALGNVSINGLKLNRAFEAGPSTNAVLISSSNDVEAGKAIHINDISIDSDAFSYSSFLWQAGGISPRRVKGGNVTVNGFSAKLLDHESGTGTVLNGDSRETIFHNLNFTPTIDEVQISPTNSAIISEGGGAFIFGVGGSSLVVDTVSAMSTTDGTFSWAITKHEP